MLKKIGEVVLALLLTAAIVAAGIQIGEYLFNNNPQVKITRALTAGRKAMSEHDWETALDDFRQILAIEPDHNVAKHEMENTYVSWSNTYVNEGDYGNAVNRLKEGLKELGNDVTMTSQLSDLYLSWAQSEAEEGNYEEALQILKDADSDQYAEKIAEYDSAYADTYLQKAQELEGSGDLDGALQALREGSFATGDSRLSDATTEVEEKRQAQLEAEEKMAENISALDSLIDTVKADLQNSSYDDAYNALHGGYSTISAVMGDNSKNYVAPEKGYGIYYVSSAGAEDGVEDYAVYIGDYDGENRQSEKGFWLIPTSAYIAQGPWRNDRPQDWQTVWVGYLASQATMKMNWIAGYDGLVTDGLFEQYVSVQKRNDWGGISRTSVFFTDGKTEGEDGTYGIWSFADPWY